MHSHLLFLLLELLPESLLFHCFYNLRCFYCVFSCFLCYLSRSWSLNYFSCSYNLRFFYGILSCFLCYLSCSRSLCYFICSYNIKCFYCILSCFLCWTSWSDTEPLYRETSWSLNPSSYILMISSSAGVIGL